MNILTQSDIERFWGKVDKDSSQTFYNEIRCWEWIAFCNPLGYGMFRIGLKTELAHRVVWVIFNGAIQNGLLVLHHCDNPSCVNPSHLFLGTDKINANDRELKRRGNHPTGLQHGAYTHPEKVVRGDKHYAHLHPETLQGENNPNSKLTYAQVIEIRHRYKNYGVGGEGSLKLAKDFGVSSSTILSIVHNKNWKE